MMTQMAPNRNKPLSRGLWWLLFVAATFILSLCFQTFKAFTLAPTLGNGLGWMGMLALLGLTLTVLLYDSYVNERNQGKIQHPLGLFEWVYRKQYPDDTGPRPGDKGDFTP